MEQLVVGPFKRKIVRAQLVTLQTNKNHFSNVMIHPCGWYAKCPFVSEDSLASVGEDETVLMAVRNETAAEKATTKTKTVIGKAELTTFVLEPISVKTSREASSLLFEQVN